MQQTSLKDGLMRKQLGLFGTVAGGLVAGAKSSTAAPLDRLLPVFLLPSEVVYSGLAAADKIKLTTQGSARTLTIPVPQYNTNLIATIDRSGFPTKTEMTVGGKVYTGEYTEFDNDHMDNHV